MQGQSISQSRLVSIFDRVKLKHKSVISAELRLDFICAWVFPTDFSGRSVGPFVRVFRLPTPGVYNSQL